ncbi:acetylcholinesterase [Octopus sinensis]|nr:acetylcholinesterase [Octopus sinensis]XP_036357024.1 acetylcholinesterase [Octopus sinensis]
MDLGRYTDFLLVLGVYILCLFMRADASQDPIVTTSKGKVRGFRKNVDGKQVDVYYGIPFAKPPLGNLRFRHPQPNDPWSGIFNATVKPNSCMQGFDKIFKNFSGENVWHANTPRSEDCLYLNVYVPKVKKPIKNKAVFVWIYGGGFYSGTSTLDIYDPSYLVLLNDVIVVSIQYRVSVLGFLALGIPEAPGNAGMFDQLMGLDWIQREIRNFGGNPRNVTLFGESAGAASVAFHLVSPLSRSKFDRAILQSGSLTCPWAVISREEAFRRSKVLAEKFKCSPVDTAWDIYKCLKAQPAKDFPDYVWYVVEGISQFPFVLIVDGTFLVETPEISLATQNFKRVPLLVGSNKNEGTYFLAYFRKDIFDIETNALISKEIFRILSDTLIEYYPQYPTKLNSFGRDAVLYQYTNWENPDDKISNRNKLDQLVTDYNFLCQVNQLAEAYSNAGEKVYYYYFTQIPSQSPWPKWVGAYHAAEIEYIFGSPVDRSKNFLDNEVELSKKMMRFWTNYAKTGDPNKNWGEQNLQEWPVHTAAQKEYLYLNADNVHNLLTGKGLRAKECAFWKEYLPRLVAATLDISEAEKQWKMQFAEYSQKYIVDWRHQFENFVKNHEKRMANCKNDS